MTLLQRAVRRVMAEKQAFTPAMWGRAHQAYTRASPAADLQESEAGLMGARRRAAASGVGLNPLDNVLKPPVDRRQTTVADAQHRAQMAAGRGALSKTPTLPEDGGFARGVGPVEEPLSAGFSDNQLLARR